MPEIGMLSRCEGYLRPSGM